MVDGDYVRLGAACHCGKSLPARKLGAGGPARIFCSPICKTRKYRGNKPADEIRSYVCECCKKCFESASGVAPKYCSNACKVRAFKAARPGYDRKYNKALPQQVKDQRAKERVERNKRLKIAAAKRKHENRERDLAAARIKSRELAERLHRQDAKVLACEECAVEFCPIYGASHMVLCLCCKQSRARAHKSAQKAIRRAAQLANPVDPYKVFHEAGWKCQICGVDTPRSKRGTYDDDAPELDHIRPLAKGGEHSYANTQCACRKCNSEKSDTWQREPLTPIAQQSL